MSGPLRIELVESRRHFGRAALNAVGSAAEVLTPPHDRTRVAAARGWDGVKRRAVPVQEKISEGAAEAREARRVKACRRRRRANARALLATAIGVGATVLAIRRLAADVRATPSN